MAYMTVELKIAGAYFMAYMTKIGKCQSRIVCRNVNMTTRKFAKISPIKIPPHLKCAFLPPFGYNLTIHLRDMLACLLYHLYIYSVRR